MPFSAPHASNATSVFHCNPRQLLDLIASIAAEAILNSMIVNEKTKEGNSFMQFCLSHTAIKKSDI